MLGRLTVGLLLLLLPGCATAAAAKPGQEYVSPDGKIRAIVVQLRKEHVGAAESRVELRARDGAVLMVHSYASADGEHGFRVERATWTPDSRFFVYSLSNSGGHQPWHAPIEFISVRGLKVRSLDGYVGPIGDANFTVAAPDRVRAPVVGAPSLQVSTVDVSLSEIVARGRNDAEQAAPPDRANAPSGERRRSPTSGGEAVP